MSPAAITIQTALPVGPSPASPTSPTSPTSPSLYVPIHKRTSANSSPTSSASSSRAVSLSRPDRIATPAHPFIYTRTQLMAFSSSPLAHMTPETREDLKARFPPLFLSRKQRKAIEYHARAAENVTPPTLKVAQPAQQQPQPQQRRSVRPGRTPPARRNATKVIEQLSWRGRAPAPMALPALIAV